MTNILKRLAAALAVCIFTLPLSSCAENDGSGGIFKYDINANPQTLDPQSTDDPNSDLIIANVYMGLFTVNPDGSLGEGVASDYTVSDDGLLYSFTLREDVYWVDSNGFEAQCTAHDFVYGFQRLFDPKTRAPRAEEYYCIKNSAPISRGFIPDPSLLGVRAVSDFELEITLDYPDPQLPQLLTEPPAMPCNEEYFIGAQGKYGLSAEATPSNGAFYVRTWDYDPYTITDNNHLILRRNEKNSESRRVYPLGLNFFISDESGFVSDFVSGTTSCIAVTDEQAAELSGKFTSEEYANITAGLLLNLRYEPFKSEDFRLAAASLVDRERLAEVHSHYASAWAVVPGEVSLLDQSYREYAGERLCPQYSVQAAQRYYQQALPSFDAELLVGARIILTDDTAAETVSYIMQEWQREFGFYCVVERLEQPEYNERLRSGDFELAFVELTGGANTPEAYLESFSSGAAAGYSGFRDTGFRALMSNADKATDLAESADLYAKAEKLLLDKAVFIPLYYKNEYFFVGEDCSDIVYNPFTKTVDFSQAKTK